MKRLHISLNVSDIEKSIQFYSDLFGAQPTLLKEDYAQWMLADPLVNLTLERSSQPPGLSHAGIQVESSEELREVYDRIAAAELPYSEEGTTTCCYHRSDKSWTQDPDGLPWEAFLTHHQTQERGTGNLEIPLESGATPAMLLPS